MGAVHAAQLLRSQFRTGVVAWLILLPAAAGSGHRGCGMVRGESSNLLGYLDATAGLLPPWRAFWRATWPRHHLKRGVDV